jgi:PadR family transcriptional regulator AphA
MSLKNALLGLLTYGPKSGYEIKIFFNKSINHFWNADIGQIYRDLSSLEQEGLVVASKELQQGERYKKIYTITEAGREVFLNWLNHYPVRFKTQNRNEFLLHLFFSSQNSLEEIKFKFQIFIKEKQETLDYLSDAKLHFSQSLAEQPQIKDLFFWNLTGELCYLTAKTSIEWAEKCIKEIDLFMKEERSSMRS